MTNTLVEEPTKAPSDTVRLRSRHDFALTTKALEVRSEDLKKLAKKADDEGYRREAKAIRADAEAIEIDILPSFRDQRELPLVSEEQLEKEIAAALRILVVRAFDGLDDPKVPPTPTSLERRRENLLEALTKRTTTYATTIADEAFNQGVAAREQSAESIAMRAVRELRVS